MRTSLRFLTAFLMAIVTLMAALPSSNAQPRGEEMQPPLDEPAMKRFWRKADESLHHIQLIHIYTRYCKPPEEPNIEATQWEIDFEQENLNTLAHEFAKLRAAYLNSYSSAIGGSARADFPPLDGYTPFGNEYWAKSEGLLTRNQILLTKKQEALNKKSEEDCSGKKRTLAPPPPPPPPTEPGIRLPSVTIREVEIPSSPARFCTAAEKQAAIYNLTKVGFDFYLNYQSARIYHDTIQDALARGQGNADVLRGLLPEAKKNLDLHTKRHDDYEAELARVRAMPVEDCGKDQPQPPPQDTTPIPLPDYEYLVWPAVPNRFCSEDEKRAVLSQLETAEGIARDNRAKAKAQAAAVQNRLDAGDRTPGLPQAKTEALQAESSFHKLEIQLDRDYHKAQAMPVENCGPPRATGDRGVLRGADAGANVGTSPPPPADVREETAPSSSPPPPPATGGSGKSKEFGIRYGAGYIEANTPQQFIGRIVIGGEDNAMIYTSPSLAGFYVEAEADFWETAARYAGEFAGFRIAASFADMEGDEYRRVEPDPTITTGFLWIDPLQPGLPFAVGLGGTNLAWDARTSTEQIDAAAMALYMQYRNLGPELTGGIGAGVMADYRNTEHLTRIELLNGPVLTVDENYDFETFGLGPRIEGELKWNRDPTGSFPRFGASLRAFVGGTYEWRDSQVWQRAIGPGFDVVQRVEFDDDGFNLHYGANATLEVKFDERTTAFMKVGWQGQSDAPTIIPADGSVAPGVPIRADTESADAWFIGGGLRIQF